MIHHFIVAISHRSSSLVIVVDLTRPTQMAEILNKFTDSVQTHIRDELCANNLTLNQQLTELAQGRIQMNQRARSSENKESDRNVLLIPLTIIGSKYDLFQACYD